LAPGAQHPWQPLTTDDAAELLRVPVARIEEWSAIGLLRQADGRFTALDLINWTTWNRLTDCPVLARRWQTFRTWFLGAAAQRPRTRRWQRRPHLFLPGIPDHLIWRLPAPLTVSGQQVVQDDGVQAAGFHCHREEHPQVAWWVLNGVPSSAVVTATGEAQIRLMPDRILSEDTIAHARLVDAMAAVVERFRYEYRFHPPGELHPALARPAQQGSCLDIALALGDLLGRDGWTWRLGVGIVARSGIANPHAWLECRGDDGAWIPLDPTLPAVERMLGGDWRAVLGRAVGVRDTARITLALVGADDPPLVAAEAVIAGTTHDAGDCYDWACADCADTF
jgi:hypothetical protein